MRAYAEQSGPDNHHSGNGYIARSNRHKIAQKERKYQMRGNADNRKGKGDDVHVHGTNDVVFKIIRLLGSFQQEQKDERYV